MLEIRQLEDPGLGSICVVQSNAPLCLPLFKLESHARKTPVEMIEGLCYKLCMIGVAADGRTHAEADNIPG